MRTLSRLHDRKGNIQDSANQCAPMQEGQGDAGGGRNDQDSNNATSDREAQLSDRLKEKTNKSSVAVLSQKQRCKRSAKTSSQFSLAPQNAKNIDNSRAVSDAFEHQIARCVVTLIFQPQKHSIALVQHCVFRRQSQANVVGDRLTEWTCRSWLCVS